MNQAPLSMIEQTPKEPAWASLLRPLPQLSPEAFQHPEDQRATEALKSIPVFPQIVGFLSGKIQEKAMRLHHLGHCIRVGPRQAVHLYRHYIKAAEILSIPVLPELYISPSHQINAYATGVKRHAIVVTRGLLTSLPMPEVMAVLAHELGHVKCRHMENETIASWISVFGVMGISQIFPLFGQAAVMAILAPLRRWSRMAELSCDRAALLTVQDPKIVASMLARLGGWPENFGEVDFQSLRDQTEDYDRMDEDAMAAVLKIVDMLESGIYMSHPLPINRVQRILQWSEGDQYRHILLGDYSRLDQPLPPERCERCGELLGRAAKNCSNCGQRAMGTNARASCAHCGARIPEPCGNFCESCGRSLSILGNSAPA
ncbi:MAG TPA: M48 family metallopeptidase [Candidatus Angelobacter sp.]|nr:M48 family metallopeptidase [Candidatus Angelobacter sp.]